jgi:hypothetical protein
MTMDVVGRLRPQGIRPQRSAYLGADPTDFSIMSTCVAAFRVSAGYRV